MLLEKQTSFRICIFVLNDASSIRLCFFVSDRAIQRDLNFDLYNMTRSVAIYMVRLMWILIFSVKTNFNHKVPVNRNHTIDNFQVPTKQHALSDLRACGRTRELHEFVIILFIQVSMVEGLIILIIILLKVNQQFCNNIL